MCKRTNAVDLNRAKLYKQRRYNLAYASLVDIYIYICMVIYYCVSNTLLNSIQFFQFSSSKPECPLQDFLHLLASPGIGCTGMLHASPTVQSSWAHLQKCLGLHGTYHSANRLLSENQMLASRVEAGNEITSSGVNPSSEMIFSLRQPFCSCRSSKAAF